MLNKIQLEKIYFNFLNSFDSNCWIAGGAITHVLLNCVPNDIDIFFEDHDKRDRAVEKCLKDGYEVLTAGPRYIKLRDTKNIMPTMKPFDWNVSLEKRTRPSFFDAIVLEDSPLKTIKKFDFTINQVAIDKNEKFYHLSSALKDIQSKTLLINGKHPNRFSPNKAKLIIKNLRKGFTITNKELSRLFNSLPPNIDTSEDQINWLVKYIIDYRR